MATWTWTGRALTDREHASVAADGTVAAELVEDEPPDPRDTVDLNTAWHGIHWLLTGTAYDAESVAGQAIFGGEPVGPDLGYGPAHLLDVPTVRRIAKALSTISAGELAERVDPEAMSAADIYPGFWSERDIAEVWIQPRYKALRRFYQRAAKQGRPVLVAII